MSNPTREEVKQFLRELSEDPFSLQPPTQRWLCDFALRAHDMRDEILDAYEEHPEREIVHRVMEAVKEFDRAGDNSEEDPMLTEGQRRRRR